MVRRVGIVGPESTGKTTLAKQLTAHYRTAWVEEYARAYLAKTGGKYQERDLVYMARRQRKDEQEAAQRLSEGYLFCDTTREVLEVWSFEKYGRISEDLARACEGWHCDVYFLTDVDCPWMYDPLREHPKPEDRQRLFSLYQDVLVGRSRCFFVLNGEKDRRFKDARTYLEAKSNFLNPTCG